MYLITKWFGTFLCDESGVKKRNLFPRDEQEIVERLRKIEKNEILAEEKKIIKNVKHVIVNEKRLKKIGEYNEVDPFFKEINIEPEDYGFSKDLFHKASVLLAEKSIEERLKSEDLQIIQMINALDDLLQTSNLLSERLRSWSTLPTSENKLSPFKKTLSSVDEEIKRLEGQIEDDMNKIAINLSKTVGPLIGARLISLAGGITNLAVMPASTIQILGAEKALFRFKKEGGRPPKHGVIFQHPLVNRASSANRGRIARMLASKIATAAKADAFTKRDISDHLRREIEKRVKEIGG
jgi:nucleolar protein 56